MRKGAAVAESVASMTYADWPECLIRYKWVVEDALKYNDPERMFNVNRSSMNRKWDAICKVCGSGVMRREYQAHLKQHADDLKLSPSDLARRYPKYGRPVLTIVASVRVAEVAATVLDAVEGRVEEEGWIKDAKKLSTALATAILPSVSEYGGTDPVYCADCE